MSWLCCACAAANRGEPINARNSEPQTRCAYCKHWTCWRCRYADYEEHYTPAPVAVRRTVRGRGVQGMTGRGGGGRGCRGVVNEGVWWEREYEKRVQRGKDEERCCVVM
ncbi:hypothetical protein HBH69_013530 [Parastagonospora nodorum]|nr:hypothetical protein HBH69_013530 [Parastagonospora nodorum]